MKFYQTIITFLFITFGISPLFAVFENADWDFQYTKNNIRLYSDELSNINYYKAETMFYQCNADDIFSYILDPNKYSIIFPKTKEFKYVKQLSENSYIVYMVIDFFPMKDRDYLIEFTYQTTDDGYVIEWHPPESKYSYDLFEKSDCIHVNMVHGRWTIIQKSASDVYVSIEYYNDWEVRAPKKALTIAEKKNTIKAINDLREYSIEVAKKGIDK